MYHLHDQPRLARGWKRGSTRVDEKTLRLAAGRVGKVLTAYLPGMQCDSAKLRVKLETPATSAELEADRLFALGWLNWLDGVPELDNLRLAVERAAEQGDLDRLARCAYWLARVALLLEQAGAIADYEKVLRQLKGSPQGTVWFIDLLWRAGRVDRAEQIWKSVRVNRKVIACEEIPLLQARFALARGETQGAEKYLQESSPDNGVVQAECLLLMAWIAVARNQPELARDYLAQVRQRPYPRVAIESWNRRMDQRAAGTPPPIDGPVPEAFRALIYAQQARLASNEGEAIRALEEAVQVPAAAPWARYLLALAGRVDRAEVFANPTSLFLAVRSRAWLALERFRLRQIDADTWLSQLQTACTQGFPTNPTVEAFRKLATFLARKSPTVQSIKEEVAQTANDPADRRNFLRAGVELAVLKLSPEEARQLLGEWLHLEWVRGDGQIASLVRSQHHRLMIGQGESLPEGHELARKLALPDTPDNQALSTWKERLDELTDLFPPESPRRRALLHVLATQEALSRQDLEQATALLADLDSWRGLSRPPRFLLQTLVNLVRTHPRHPGWKTVLPGWLNLWAADALQEAGAVLAVHAGVIQQSPDEVPPPAGVAPAEWLLHQAARSLLRREHGKALACLAKLPADARGAVDEPTLADIHRRTHAEALAKAIAPAEVPEPAVLADFIDQLGTFPEGKEVLAALERGELSAASGRLSALVELLPEGACHHLALIEQRRALALEGQGSLEEAEPHFRTAWHAWLRHLATENAAPDRKPLFDWLLGRHRERIKELLAANKVDGARRHWRIVQQLPELAGKVHADLSADLAGRFAQFRDDLASEYLVTTREAMRYGTIPEGWNADYDRGLGYLRRLLSLDRDNLRLLTALVEICTEWFLDLYNADDPRTLGEQIDRNMPFALQLARLIENRPGELAARGTLSDFYKFRGFMAADRDEKRGLYEESLRFNPGNDNVRELLESLDRREAEE